MRISGLTGLGLAAAALGCGTPDRSIPSPTAGIIPATPTKTEITPTIVTATPTEVKRSETELEALVRKARQMEDEFKGQDLSDQTIRSEYTNLLADIYSRYYRLDTTKEALSSAVTFVNAGETTANTEADKIYINVGNGFFQKKATSSNPAFPKDWNPLKSLRIALSEEFTHFIIQPAEDAGLFLIVDSANEITNKRIYGFKFKGIRGKNQVFLYPTIEEASVKLLANYINLDLFDVYLDTYAENSREQDINNIMLRLEQVIDSAKIDKTILASLHKTSNLRGLLLLLGERYGLDPQKVNEQMRIMFGLSIFEALKQNDQIILQDYISTARKNSANQFN